jgi:uncharacterized protein (DUF885 family)
MNKIVSTIIVIALLGMLAGYVYLATYGPTAVVEELKPALAEQRTSILKQIHDEQEELAKNLRSDQENLANLVAKKVAEAKTTVDQGVAEAKRAADDAVVKAKRSADAATAASRADRAELRKRTTEVEKDVKVLERKPQILIPAPTPTPKKGWFD